MRFLNVFLCVHKNLCLNSKSVSNACSQENILTFDLFLKYETDDLTFPLSLVKSQ